MIFRRLKLCGDLLKEKDQRIAENIKKQYNTGYKTEVDCRG